MARQHQQSRRLHPEAKHMHHRRWLNCVRNCQRSPKAKRDIGKESLFTDPLVHLDILISCVSPFHTTNKYYVVILKSFANIIIHN